MVNKTQQCIKAKQAHTPENSMTQEVNDTRVKKVIKRITIIIKSGIPLGRSIIVIHHNSKTKREK